MQMGLLDMLAQAVSSGNSSQQFNQIAQSAPSDVLAKGLAAAFGSDQTPAIGNMVAQLFGQSNGAQKAGMLNQLMGALGPTVMGGLAGGVLGRVLEPGQTQVTPEQAQQLTQQQVQDVINHANEVHPGVADHLGQFYAQHKGLIDTLGGIAAGVALMKMREHMSQN
jgi:hypothetical protein